MNKSKQVVPSTGTTCPASWPEIEAITRLMACASEIEYMQQPLMERLRACTDNGWRDLRMLYSVAKKLVATLSGTLPETKRRTVLKNAASVRIKLVYGPQAAKDKDVRLLLADDLGVIIAAASEQCKLCMGSGKQCRGCQLGKALDSAAWFDRGADAWWEVFSRGEAAEA